MRQPKIMLSAASALAALAAPAPAQSQTAEPQALNQIVITAQKREQRLQDVPISVSVLDAGTLDNARIRSLYDTNQMLPNFAAEKSPGVSVISIRGMGGGGRNIGFDSRVGVYIDGVYMGQAQALGVPLFGVQQVEVLRGPQGHLFGRNTVAGAVNIVTEAPAAALEGSLRGVLGNLQDRELYATVSGPLGAGLGGHLAVASERRGGATLNLFSGQKIDDLDRLSLRGQLRWAASSRLTAALHVDHSDSRELRGLGEATTSFSDRPFPTGPLPEHQVNVNTTPELHVRLSGASLNLGYRLDDGSTLTAITAQRNTWQRRVNDADYSSLDAFSIRYQDRFKQLSQELRLASANQGAWRHLLGLYVLREDATTDRVALGGADGALVRVPPTLVATNNGLVRTNTAALFGQADWVMGAGFTLNLGARYTQERKAITYHLHGGAALGLATLDNFQDSRRDKRFTPSLGLLYALDRNTNAYLKYATGFKSGGWNADFVRTTQVADGLAFNTETVGRWELGVKGALQGGALQYELAAFRSRFDNYQTFAFVPLANGSAILQLKNAAQVQSQGLEASARAKLAPGWRLGLNLGTVDTRYLSFPSGDAGVDLAGQRVPGIPRNTASVSLDHAHALPAWGGRAWAYAEYSHRDSAGQGGISPTLSSRDLVNARMGFSHDRSGWEASLWVRNLGNRSHLVGSGRDFLGNQFVTRGDPRAFGVDLKATF